MRVNDIAEVRLGRQRSPQNRPKIYPRRYLRAANVLEDGFDLSDVKQMDFKPQEFETYRLRRGDVLLSEGSGTVEQTNRIDRFEMLNPELLHKLVELPLKLYL